MQKIASVASSFLGSFMSWMSTSLKQTMGSYCDLQTADSPTVLVANDGSLLSVIKLNGVKALVGSEEFNHVQEGLQETLQTVMSQPGQTIQVYFN